MSVYLALFTTAFLSATLLPGTSEPALVAALSMSHLPVVGLVLVATAGNTLGACLNWLLGLLFSRHRPWVRLPVSPAQLARFQGFYARYGVWSLLLSWVPVIGDPLTVLAGLGRVPFLIFLPLVLAGKLARYVAIVWLFQAV